ncbi:MAG TPA: nucleoside triphosphatase YtkD [Pseudogracilibacillus sp.]|nr:nucleoside triphosphatase YtkD [Pseudogracilibacillus sp.]
MEYIFQDYYSNEVTLSFSNEPFSKTPKHVWVICMFAGKWLLTDHKTRGLEFPGGKVEAGETAAEAARREVLEETGGVVDTMHYVAQYHVAGKHKTIIKNVYFATIQSLEEQETYYETHGPVLLREIPDDVRMNKRFSFMMKDDVLSRCMDFIKSHYV